MNSHLANISQRQVTGRWMDRAFLAALIVLTFIGGSSVAMAVSAASTAPGAQRGQDAPLVDSASTVRVAQR